MVGVVVLVAGAGALVAVGEGATVVVVVATDVVVDVGGLLAGLDEHAASVAAMLTRSSPVGSRARLMVGPLRWEQPNVVLSLNLPVPAAATEVRTTTGHQSDTPGFLLAGLLPIHGLGPVPRGRTVR